MADKINYQEYTRTELFNLLNLFMQSNDDVLADTRPDIMCKAGINDIYRNIVHVLSNGAKLYVPVKGKAFKGKHWWNNSLSQAKQNSLKSHRKWLDAGKPKDGLLFKNMLDMKKSYKKNDS